VESHTGFDNGVILGADLQAVFFELSADSEAKGGVILQIVFSAAVDDLLGGDVRIRNRLATSQRFYQHVQCIVCNQVRLFLLLLGVDEQSAGSHAAHIRELRAHIDVDSR
jgi:hypothetical protein